MSHHLPKGLNLGAMRTRVIRAHARELHIAKVEELDRPRLVEAIHCHYDPNKKDPERAVPSPRLTRPVKDRGRLRSAIAPTVEPAGTAEEPVDVPEPEPEVVPVPAPPVKTEPTESLDQESDEEEEDVPYTEYTKDELKEALDYYEIEYTSRMSKDDLVVLLDD